MQTFSFVTVQEKGSKNGRRLRLKDQLSCFSIPFLLLVLELQLRHLLSPRPTNYFETPLRNLDFFLCKIALCMGEWVGKGEGRGDEENKL